MFFGIRSCSVVLVDDALSCMMSKLSSDLVSSLETRSSGMTIILSGMTMIFSRRPKLGLGCKMILVASSIVLGGGGSKDSTHFSLASWMAFGMGSGLCGLTA